MESLIQMTAEPTSIMLLLLLAMAPKTARIITSSETPGVPAGASKATSELLLSQDLMEKEFVESSRCLSGHRPTDIVESILTVIKASKLNSIDRKSVV